jgi:prepilin-type processing-associated H-X9-DG protein
MNLWLCRVNGNGTAPGYLYTGYDPQFGRSDWVWNTQAVQGPANIPVFGDCNWVGGWPFENNTPPTDLVTGDLSVERDIGRHCLIRHGKSVNFVFLDGHAEPVRLEDLWKLSWHKDWQPRTVTITYPS